MQKGVDLVEISPNAEPPVCRLINYSKFLYQQKKRQKELKAKQVKIEVKEIRFGPQTDEHDYNFKLKHAKEFLSHVVNYSMQTICLNLFVGLGLAKQWAMIPTLCICIPVNFLLVRFFLKK